MPEEALQVYVSSTWIDLEQERTAVREVTHRLRGLQFLGMEYFGSRDESTVRTSVAEVDRADLYVGVIGGRYGSGITEQEYSRARERGVPAFIYFKRAAGEPSMSPAEGLSGDERLEAFSRRLRDLHTCSEFTTADDLASKLTADLHNWLLAQQLKRGISRVSTNHLPAIRSFVEAYLGSETKQVPFGGRGEELQKLDGWLADPATPPFLLLAAGAGKGKSALLVRWVSTLLSRSDIVPVFFPVSIRFNTNLASVVFPYLATSVAALHDEVLKATPDTPAEVWRSLLTDLLARPLPDGRRLLLIVDGLDESADWKAGADLFPPHIGRHARVVVSARFLAGDADARDWRRRLGWDDEDVVAVLALNPLPRRGVADVLGRMGVPLAALGTRSEIVTEIHRLSDGEPLVVRLYVDDLLRRGEASAQVTLEDLRAIKPGLDGFFERWWKEQRELWRSSQPLQQRRVQALMNFLACALGPLRRDDLIALADPGLELNTWTLEEALEPLQRFIVGDGRETGYVYSHPGLAIHFRGRLSRSERDAVDRRIRDWCVASIEDLAHGRLSPEELSAYIVQYFGAHLERADADISHFSPLLTDAWRRAWHAHDGSYAGYRGDLTRVRLAVTRQAAAGKGVNADAVALAFRTAMCIGSVDQLAANTPPELVVALVERGVWSRAGAIAYARLIRDHGQRAKALINLASLASDDAQAQILGEALDATSRVDDEGRAALLAAATPVLPAALIADALSLALSIGNRRLMAQAVVGMAPRLGVSHVERVLEVVASLEDLDLRSLILSRFAAAHPVRLSAWLEERPDVEPWERAWILIGVSNGTHGRERFGMLERVFSLAAQVTNEPARVSLMLAVIERFDQSEREPFVAAVKGELERIAYAPTRAAAYARLCGLVDRGSASDMCRAALDACALIRSDHGRCEVLAALAPHVTAAEASAALALVERLEDDAIRAQAAALLLPALDATARERALAHLVSVVDPFERLCAALPVSTLVPHEPFISALEELDRENISAPWHFRLVRAFATQSRERLLYLGAERWLLDHLAHCAALAPLCSPHERGIVDARFLKVLAEYDGYPFAGDTMPEALEFLAEWAASAGEAALAAMVDVVARWRSVSPRVAVIDRLAPCLPAAQLQSALARILTIGDVGMRRQLELHCVSLIPPDVVTGALAAVWKALAPSERAFQMMQWLVDGAADRQRLRAEILAMLPEIERDAVRAEIIAAFVRHVGAELTDAEVTSLLDAALQLDIGMVGRNALSLLMPCLQNEHLTRFPEIFDALLDDSDEAAAVAADFAARVPSDQSLLAFQVRCARVLASDEHWRRGRQLLGLVRLALRLDESIRSSALDYVFAGLAELADDEKRELLFEIARGVEADADLFTRCFAVVRALPPAERVRTGLLLIERLAVSGAEPAAREVVGWLGQLPRDEQLRALETSQPSLSGDVAKAGARVAAAVLTVLPRLAETGATSLADAAFEDLARLDPHLLIARAFARLLPIASRELQDRLVEQALPALSSWGDASERLEIVQDLLHHDSGALIAAKHVLGLAREPAANEHAPGVSRVLGAALAVMPHADVLHLWQEAVRYQVPGSILYEIAEWGLGHIDGLAELVFEWLDSLPIPERIPALRNFATRLASAAPDRVIAVVRSLGRPEIGALAFAYAVPYVPAGRKDELKTLAVAALAESADSLGWSELIDLMETMGGDTPPDVERRLLAAFDADPDPRGVAGKAADLLPRLPSATRVRVASRALAAIALPASEAQVAKLYDLEDSPADLAHALRACASWQSAFDYVPLLPVVRPAGRAAIVDLATRGDRWFRDSELVALLCEHASDRQVAALLGARLSACASAVPIETALRICACSGTDIGPWLPVLMEGLFAAAKGSRAELMQLVDRALPDLHRISGPAIVPQILASVHELGEWWP